MSDIISFFTNLGFGIGDYIVVPIGLLIAIVIILIILDDFEIAGIISYSILGLILVGIPIYFNHIPNGTYKAKIIEKNGLVVGEGTTDSSKFDITITDDFIKLDNSFKFAFNSDSSNFYTKHYSNYKGRTIKVTSMGNVSVYNKEGIKITILKVYN